MHPPVWQQFQDTQLRNQVGSKPQNLRRANFFVDNQQPNPASERRVVNKSVIQSQNQATLRDQRLLIEGQPLVQKVTMADPSYSNISTSMGAHASELKQESQASAP